MSEMNKTIPWSSSQFYLVDYIRMVYETLASDTAAIDQIIDYTGKRWTVNELLDRGHRVKHPTARREVRVALRAAA